MLGCGGNGMPKFRRRIKREKSTRRAMPAGDRSLAAIVENKMNLCINERDGQS